MIFEEAVIRLAGLLSQEYDRCRKEEAKRLDVRVKTLDHRVEAEWKRRNGDDGLQGSAIEWPDKDPWPEPVDGAELLTNISSPGPRLRVDARLLGRCGGALEHVHVGA